MIVHPLVSRYPWMLGCMDTWIVGYIHVSKYPGHMDSWIFQIIYYPDTWILGYSDISAPLDSWILGYFIIFSIRTLGLSQKGLDIQIHYISTHK